MVNGGLAWLGWALTQDIRDEYRFSPSPEYSSPQGFSRASRTGCPVAAGLETDAIARRRRCLPERFRLTRTIYSRPRGRIGCRPKQVEPGSAGRSRSGVYPINRGGIGMSNEIDPRAAASSSSGGSSPHRGRARLGGKLPKAKLPDRDAGAARRQQSDKSPQEAINVFDFEPVMRQNVPPAISATWPQASTTR